MVKFENLRFYSNYSEILDRSFIENVAKVSIENFSQIKQKFQSKVYILNGAKFSIEILFKIQNCV